MEQGIGVRCTIQLPWSEVKLFLVLPCKRGVIDTKVSQLAGQKMAMLLLYASISRK